MIMEKWIAISLLAVTLGVELDSEFGPPHLTVYCMEDYDTLHKYVNITWKPNPLVHLTSEELEQRLQNCEAAISCNNGHTELGHCPFNTEAEIYNGWEFNIPINENFCSIRVTYIDHDNSHDPALTTTRGNCTFSAPIPSVMVTTTAENISVGNPKEIQCVVDTDEKVNSLVVNITWKGPTGRITNDSRLTITPTVSNGTNHISILQFSYLSEDDEGLYECNGAVLEANQMEFFSLINFNIPTPNVTVIALNNQQVGDPLLLECSATTVRGITSSVDIVWITNDTEVRRANDVPGEATGNLTIYKDQYNIPSSLLKDYTLYHCQVIINAKQMVSAKAFTRIDLNPSSNVHFTTDHSSSSADSLIKGSALAGLIVSVVVAIIVFITVIICCGIFGRRKLLRCCMPGYKTEIISQMVPSIMDIDYSAIGREAASRCESLNEKDIVWNDSLRMPTVDEEFITSISSSCLTNEEMLNYLHGNGPAEETVDSKNEDDSGINVSSNVSTEQTSFFTDTENADTANVNIHHVIDICELSEEENCSNNVDVHLGGVIDSDNKISQEIMELHQSTNNKTVVPPSSQTCNTVTLDPGSLTINKNLKSHRDGGVHSNVTTSPTLPYKNSETMNVAKCQMIKNSILYDTTDVVVTLTSPDLADSCDTPPSQQKCFPIYQPAESDESTDMSAIRGSVVATYGPEGATLSPLNKSPAITTVIEGDYVDHDYHIVTLEDDITIHSS